MSMSYSSSLGGGGGGASFFFSSFFGASFLAAGAASAAGPAADPPKLKNELMSLPSRALANILVQYGSILTPAPWMSLLSLSPR